MAGTASNMRRIRRVILNLIRDHILCKNIQFSIRQFRSMINIIVTETRRMIEDLLFFPQSGAVHSIE